LDRELVVVTDPIEALLQTLPVQYLWKRFVKECVRRANRWPHTQVHIASPNIPTIASISIPNLSKSWLECKNCIINILQRRPTFTVE
jgi:hypothetical protein